MTDEAGNSGDQRVSIGRIPIKQVRVVGKRAEGEPSKPANPMNALVPYLDLFCRLGDEELARLAEVDVDVVAGLRRQVITVDEGLAAYADLLPRLSDDELVRLTGATPKTIRFWRLCQPLVPAAALPLPREPGYVARASRARGGLAEAPPPAEARGPAPAELEPTGPSDSGLHERVPEAQARVASMMDFSGDPFPGFDDERHDGPS